MEPRRTHLPTTARPKLAPSSRPSPSVLRCRFLTRFFFSPPLRRLNRHLIPNRRRWPPPRPPSLRKRRMNRRHRMAVTSTALRGGRAGASRAADRHHTDVVMHAGVIRRDRDLPLAGGAVMPVPGNARGICGLGLEARISGVAVAIAEPGDHAHGIGPPGITLIEVGRAVLAGQTRGVGHG